MRPGWTKPKPWKRKDETYLRRFYARLTLERLARHLRRTACSVKSRASKLHLDKGTKHRWTAPEDELLRKSYPNTVTKKIAEHLGLNLCCVYNRAWGLGLEKSAAFRAELFALEGERLRIVGAAHRYPKGHIPANAGSRRPGWAPGRMASTQFKKGQVSPNYLPIGTVKADSDGYLRKKIADGLGGFGNPKTWELIHRRTWTDAHGPVPPGHAVTFKDGNKKQCALENLELITRRELRIRNSIHRMYPNELKRTIFAAGVLKRRIREAESGKKQTDGSAQSSL